MFDFAPEIINIEIFLDENNLVYVTISQRNMDSSINSGSYELQQTDASEILRSFMATFNNFLNSNSELRLDQSFSIHFKVKFDLLIYFIVSSNELKNLADLAKVQNVKSVLHKFTA